MNKITHSFNVTAGHSLTKLLCLAVLILIGVRLALWLCGFEPSAFLGLLTAAASVILASFVLSNRDERKTKWEYLLFLVSNNWWGPVRIMGLLTVMLLAYGARSSPVEPLVRQIGVMVETFGLMVAIMVPWVSRVLNGNPLGRWEGMRHMANCFLWNLTVYAVALWVIGAVGDDTYHWVVTKPDEAIVALATIIICRMISLVSYRPVATNVEARYGAASRAGGMVPLKRATVRDTRYMAAHEAGHALVYAALGDLPADVRIVLNEQSDNNGVLGFITGINSKHRLEEKSFAEWQMLVLLAGQEGEKAFHGEATLGSSNDHHRWIGAARNYFACNYRGIYYADPHNKFEHEQNEAKFEELQAEQLAMLHVFFDMNAEVFQQLVNALLDKRTMERDDLLPFLSKVKFPDGFPLPYGPFAQFSEVWAEDMEEHA